MVLRPVRFADGRLVPFRSDHIAMLLKIGEMVLLVGGLFWWLTGSFNRYVALLLNDWGIRHYSRKVERLLALAEDADVGGDESAAAKYRDRAVKHQSTVDKCRELKAEGIKPFG